MSDSNTEDISLTHKKVLQLISACDKILELPPSTDESVPVLNVLTQYTVSSRELTDSSTEFLTYMINDATDIDIGSMYASDIMANISTESSHVTRKIADGMLTLRDTTMNMGMLEYKRQESTVSITPTQEFSAQVQCSVYVHTYVQIISAIRLSCKIMISHFKRFLRKLAINPRAMNAMY